MAAYWSGCIYLSRGCGLSFRLSLTVEQLIYLPRFCFALEVAPWLRNTVVAVLGRTTKADSRINWKESLRSGARCLHVIRNRGRNGGKRRTCRTNFYWWSCFALRLVWSRFLDKNLSWIGGGRKWRIELDADLGWQLNRLKSFYISKISKNEWRSQQVNLEPDS